jgi:hypothetical protein
MDRDTFERLYKAREAAQDAVREHYETLRRMTWYEGQPSEWKGERVLDREWLDRHRMLTDERDRAEAQLTSYLQGEGRR